MRIDVYVAFSYEWGVMQIVNDVARWIVPYALWIKLRDLKSDKIRRNRRPTNSVVSAFSFEEAEKHLRSIGGDLTGSMHQDSLRYLAAFLGGTVPLKGVHVGNFQGVSLSFFACILRELNPESVIVGIDPNITHRNLANPQAKVLSLLNHFGLQKNAMILTGYSLEKSVADDGRDYSTPHAYLKTENAYSSEPSCENQLENLAKLCPNTFDFALIDGNHEGSYLSRELEFISRLLRPGGYLFLDDVSTTWFEIERVFEQADRTGVYEKVASNGWVGVLKKLPASA